MSKWVAPVPSHTYSVAGTYNARLTVTDSGGASTSARITIWVDPATTLRFSNIGLSATLRKIIVTVRSRVTVVDASGSPLPGAVVYITWTLPGGSVTTQTATTNSNGVAIFTVKGQPWYLYIDCQGDYQSRIHVRLGEQRIEPQHYEIILLPSRGAEI